MRLLSLWNPTITKYGVGLFRFEDTPYYILTRAESQQMYMLYNADTKRAEFLSPNKQQSINKAFEIVEGLYE